MFYFKGCFKAMEDLGILDMGDPFQRESLTIKSNFSIYHRSIAIGIDIGLKGSMSADVF